MLKCLLTAIILASAGCTATAPPGYAPGAGNVGALLHASTAPAIADVRPRPSTGPAPRIVDLASVVAANPAVIQTPALQMRVGSNNYCLEYQNSLHAKLRVVATSVIHGWGWPNPSWNLVDLVSGFRQGTDSIDYLGWDGKRYTAEIHLHETFLIGGDAWAKFYWRAGNLETDTMAFVGIHGEHYIATIVANHNVTWAV